MADSINSTTTPAFSRRSLLTGAGALPLAATARAAQSSPQDPALALWRDWQANFQEVTQLVRKWQRLETRLFATSRSPRVSIRLSDRDGEEKDLVLFSPEDIERWLPDASAAEKARLRAALEERERRWREAKRAIGFDIVDAELNAAYDRRREMMALTGETSAAGLAAIALDARRSRPPRRSRGERFSGVSRRHAHKSSSRARPFSPCGRRWPGAAGSDEGLRTLSFALFK